MLTILVAPLDQMIIIALGAGKMRVVVLFDRIHIVTVRKTRTTNKQTVAATLNGQGIGALRARGTFNLLELG